MEADEPRARELLEAGARALDENDYDHCVELCRELLSLPEAAEAQRRIAEKRIRDAHPDPGRPRLSHQRHLYHVAPMFLLADILEHGGIRCGADTQLDGLPRRVSSRESDDTTLTDEHCDIRLHDPLVPSECVLLFRRQKEVRSLVNDKIKRRHRTPSKGYPHCVLRFDSSACLRASRRTVYGAEENVGRTLQAGRAVSLRAVRFVADLETAIQEVMIRAEGLEDRMLLLSACDEIRVFSEGDAEIVREMLGHKGLADQITVDVRPEADYLAARANQPQCQRCVAWTGDYCRAVMRGDVRLADEMRERLALCCFDKPPEDPADCE